MKRGCIYLVYLIATVLMTTFAKAQVDPHFSQYYIYPHYMNPASTGLIEGDYRVSGIYRNQWSNISTPYSTAAITADFTTNKNMNYGANILNQTAGNGGYSLLNGYASLAYTGLKFGFEGYQHIVLGMQAGFISRRIDPTKFQMGDQWNPITGYSPINPTSEQWTNTSTSVLDMGAGALYYDGNPEKSKNAFLGVAAFHINKPKDPFNPQTKGYIPMRITVHGGMNFLLSEFVSMTPHFLYMSQGSAYELMIGDYFEVNASDETDFLFGLNYRYKDAISPFAGITNKGFTIAATYDVNMSTLGKMANGAGSVEITLSYMIKNPEKFSLKCPHL